MFFLLPVIAGVISSAAATAGKVALGIGAATAIGAGIKGAIDLKDASDYQDIARYKINEAVDKTKKEISKTQDELTNFARLKVQTFNGVLKKAVNYLNSNTKIHPERIGRLTNLYKASSSKYDAGISHGSISLNCNQFIGSNLDNCDKFKIPKYDKFEVPKYNKFKVPKYNKNNLLKSKGD